MSTAPHAVSPLPSQATRTRIHDVTENTPLYCVIAYRNNTTRYDMKVFNVQSKNLRLASLVYHTRSETKRNNGKKIKQTDERNKSERTNETKSEKLCFILTLIRWCEDQRGHDASHDGSHQEHCHQLDCAERAQTSAQASNLNQKWSGIRTQISGLTRMSAGSLPKCCRFITLSASVISPSVVKISRWLYEKLIDLSKSHIPQCWGRWKSDPESVSGTWSITTES